LEKIKVDEDSGELRDESGRLYNPILIGKGRGRR
jgi:hypothetical protein